MSHDKKIQLAYKNKDGGASKTAHQNKMDDKKYKFTSVNSHNEDGDDDDSLDATLVQASPEKHKGDAGAFIKSIIFGGLDGIITLFAIVSSISGSDLEVETVLVLGFAKLVGDGISMGVGDFLSEKAEIDFTKSEMKREKWEFDNYKEGEIKEMIEIYKDKGFSEEDATLILRTMSKYPDFFLEHMMMEELELDPNCIDDNPLKNGGITFLSFLIFGTVPLLSYLIFIPIDLPESGTDWMLIISVILTSITLFAMGAVKGHYCNVNIWKSGFFVMLNGVLAAGSAYLIGWALSELLGVHGLGHGA